VRLLFGILRLLVALAIIVAIVGQFANSLSMVPDPAAFVLNFFSFFTILSNAIAAIVLLIGAWFCLRTQSDPCWYNFARAAIVTYMTTTLVVYNLLLRDISLDQATTVPWSNEILHVWAPLYLLLDWVFAPGRRRVPWSRFWLIAAFPIGWVIYTMIRGAVVGWYPYPFLDPSIAPGLGYRGVAVYVIAIAAFILLVGSAIVGISQSRWPYRRVRDERAGVEHAGDEHVGDDRGERVTA